MPRVADPNREKTVPIFGRIPASWPPLIAKELKKRQKAGAVEWSGLDDRSKLTRFLYQRFIQGEDRP